MSEVSTAPPAQHSEHRFLRLLAQLARCPEMTPQWLEETALQGLEFGWDDILVSIAENHATPASVLERLIARGSEHVRASARYNLNTLSGSL